MTESNGTGGGKGIQLTIPFVKQRKKPEPATDLVGQRFGSLIVVEVSTKTLKKTTIKCWLCRCDCGGTTKVGTTKLRTKHTTSCGCEKNKGRRRGDLIGNRYGMLTVVGMAPDRIHGNTVRACWTCRCDCNDDATCVVAGTKLVGRHTKSCGCRRHTGSRPMDLSGRRYGSLTVLYRTDSRRGKQQSICWLCLCECGTLKEVSTPCLRKGRTLSCGCYAESINRTHGESKKVLGLRVAEYDCWQHAIRRCENPRDRGYPNYGGRGIRICAGWRSSYVNFITDMGRKPEPRHSIDRIDNEANYSCGRCEECVARGWVANCRWATTKQQRDNQRKRGRIEQFTTEEMTVVLQQRGFSVVPTIH